MLIGKKYHFDSAHFLPHHEGKCKNLHGHRWDVEIEISGPIKEGGPQDGMVIDFKALDLLVNPILDQFDHHLINDLLPYSPTAENIARHIYSCLVLNPEFKEPSRMFVAAVRVYESPECYAEARIGNVY